MKILIDGDACCVIKATEYVAKIANIPCHIYCDCSHLIDSDYSETHIVGTSRDAADFAIINKCDKNDIVITNDSGLAAMVLAKHGYAIKSNGIEFTNKNINQYLNRRYVNSRARRKTNRNQIHGQLYERSAPVRKSYIDVLLEKLEMLSDRNLIQTEVIAANV